MRQCRGSLESVYNQCANSMSEIFKLGGSTEPVFYCPSTALPIFGPAGPVAFQCNFSEGPVRNHLLLEVIFIMLSR